MGGMDRLTQNAGGFNFGLQGRTREVALKRNHFMRGSFECGGLTDALAAYEDTGLTPDEIAALRAENDALRGIIERMAEESNRPITSATTRYDVTLNGQTVTIFDRRYDAALEGGQQ
jgi:hypothetical protein